MYSQFNYSPEKDQYSYELFWNEAAEKAAGIHWFNKWTKTFELEYPTFKWFSNGTTNICYSALDAKVEQGQGDTMAFIYENGDTGENRTVTYRQLLDIVKTYASSLKDIGVKRGDRVAVYMPMCIEAAAIMLACARIGAIHMVIFAGFSSGAIADRLELSGASYIITQSNSYRRNKIIPLKTMVDEAIGKLSHHEQIKHIIVFQPDDRDFPIKSGRDILSEEFLTGAGAKADCEHMEANEPLFLLPTSGTTSRPKVVVHTCGGYQVYIYCMAKWMYGLDAADRWFCTSDIGWIVGHSYNIYGPLLCGSTSILYNGTPDHPRNDMWWDIIEKHKVTGVFTSPTGIRALMRSGLEPARNHSLENLKRVFSAGEVLNPAAWKWLQKDVLRDTIPVIDHMWQTETGGAIIGNPWGLGMFGIKPGSAGKPVPGVIVDIVDEKDGHSLEAGKTGHLVIRKPFPGLTPMLWQNLERYRNDYWEAKPGTKGIYLAGDAASWDEDGYLWFAGRADEVMKIAAHRIGTIEVENALISHPAVAESAVCGVPDDLRGEVASACVVLSKKYEPSEILKKELIQHVRKEMGAVVVVKDIIFVNILPKTRSGKLMRRIIKSILTNKELGDISTIEEEASLSEIKTALRDLRRI